MSIRPATLDDLPAIIAMGETLHNESPRWRRLTFSRMRAADMISRLIADPNGLVLVATKGDQIIGGIAAYCFQHWSSEEYLAEELTFFMMPEHRGSFAAGRLICAMKRWSELRGARWLIVGTSTGVDPERTAKLYEHMGFSRCSIGLEG